MKIQTLTIPFLENFDICVKATRGGTVFVDHALGSQESLLVVVVKVIVVPRVVSSCDGTGLVSRLTVEGNNFESDYWVFGENDLTIVDLLETEGEVAGLSGGDHLTCFFVVSWRDLG